MAFTSAELSERTLHRRAIEAVIWGMPAVNAELMFQAMRDAKADFNQVVYWSRPVSWKNQTLTPNPDTIYLMPFFNTQDAGPMVLEIPPADGENSITGSIDEGWQTAIEDVGPAGVDKGKGGKYLILPPGYKGHVPEGYIALSSGTYAGYALLRSNLKPPMTPTSPRRSHMASGSGSIRSRRRQIRRKQSSSMRTTSCSTAPFRTTCAFSRFSTNSCSANHGRHATRS